MLAMVDWGVGGAGKALDWWVVGGGVWPSSGRPGELWLDNGPGAPQSSIAACQCARVPSLFPFGGVAFKLNKNSFITIK